MLPGIIRKFRDLHPGIDIEIVSCDADRDIEKMIASREVDCGFMPSIPYAGIEYFPLMEESLMVAVPPDHPMADKKKFPLSEMGNYPYIMFSFDKPDFNDLIVRNGIKPRTAFTVDNDYAAMAMVSQGLGMCIFPQILLNDIPFPIRCLELDPPLRRSISIATRSMDTCTRSTREFIRCTREWVEEMNFSLE